MAERESELEGLLSATRSVDAPDPEARERVKSRLMAKLGVASLAAPLGASPSVTTLGAATGSTVQGTAAGTGATAGTSLPTALGAGAGAASQGLVGVKIWLAAAAIAGAGATGIGLTIPTPSHPAETTDTPPVATAAMPRNVADRETERALLPGPPTSPASEGSEPESLGVQAADIGPTYMRRAHARDPKRTPAPPATASDAHAGPVPWRTELRLLQAAQAALRTGDYQAALGHAREHERRFPSGRLRRERLAVVALSRCAQGHDGGEARAALEAEAPTSALARRVRLACRR